MGASRSVGGIRVAASPGGGRLTRSGRALLFVPESRYRQLPTSANESFERFLRGDRAVSGAIDDSRCIVEWSEDADHLSVDSNLDLWVQRPDSDDEAVTLGRWIAHRPTPTDGRFVLVSNPSIDASATSTDLRDGDIHAGGFGLLLPSEPTTISLDSGAVTSAPADVTAQPQQFDELTDLDVTLTPVEPNTYPDDDTDRTFRRAVDTRCPRGHANSATHHTCRTCGAILGSVEEPPDPTASSAVAGLRLPDGSVIAIDGAVAIGRSPTAEAARVDDPMLVTLDAPATVSRTHIVLRADVDRITVTDCASRGRTAIMTSGSAGPVGLVPWEPRAVSIGDTIRLGGPTTLTITDPADLHERNETT